MTDADLESASAIAVKSTPYLVDDAETTLEVEVNDDFTQQMTHDEKSLGRSDDREEEDDG